MLSKKWVQKMAENIYVTELMKFVKQEVEVTDVFGKTHTGICKAINFQHLNIVIFDDKQKLVIKNCQLIRRKRNASQEDN